MQSLMRAFCIAYLILLTLLLLSEDPTRVIGLHDRMPWILLKLMPYAHVLSFTVLAVLALGVRWPVPRWGIILMAAVYGGMTQFLQGFTVHRTPRWTDWFHDLEGIAIGTALCWFAALMVGRFTRLRRGRDADSRAAPCDEWETLGEALSRPAAGEQSWWS